MQSRAALLTGILAAICILIAIVLRIFAIAAALIVVVILYFALASIIARMRMSSKPKVG